MNIVVLNDTCEIDGGAARIAIEDARQMAGRGHRVLFFSACGRPPAEADGIEWISLEQSNILQERRRWLAMFRGLWNFEAAKTIGQILLGLPSTSTVVHLHSWSKALSGSVLPAILRRGIPVVCTLHDYFVVCPNGGFYDYPTQQICNLSPMSMQCALRNCDSRTYTHKVWRVLRQLVWRYLARVPRDFSKMIAVSAFSEGKLRPWLSNQPLAIVENLPQMKRRALPDTEKQYGLVFAGRVASEKGVEVYLEACQKAGLQAEVWGDGPILPELKSSWPHANFPGWLDQAQLQERLRSSLALVVPSLWYETYGMVVAEAAAAGVAVIVSDHGAAATLVEPGVTGLHFRAGDVNHLAEQMCRLKEQPDLARRMGAVAYERFWAAYENSRESRAATLESIYSSAMVSRT